MCGICGVFSFEGPVERELIARMCDIMKHRGPDDAGLYVNGSMGLGHRRLSIIDLSPAGHEPMSNEDQTIWLIYNGEVYNYLELRTYLEARGHVFTSQTDAEVVIHAYEEWGEECLQHFNGMWSFALWNEREQRLFCARDRLGIKPFYYHWDRRRFRFASEIKALLVDPAVERKVNESVVYDYLARAALDHREETFFSDILRLMPAHYLTVDFEGLKVVRYWDLGPRSVQPDGSDDADCRYAARFYELFEDSIRLRLRSDVPVGTCLSGGLDSSSVVCVANQLMFPEGNVQGREVEARQKTFSACFNEPEYDERPFIEEVLAWTGAERNFIFPSANEVFDIINDVIWHQEEPFNSTSILAQWYVMKLAKERGVKVLLDGQGGDEMLAGYIGLYQFYLFMDLLARFQLGCLAREVIGFLSHHSFPNTGQLRRGALRVLSLLPSGARRSSSEVPPWLAPEFVMAYRDRGEADAETKYSSRFDEYLYRRLVGNGLPALLRYEDKNAMAFSIEARIPFLDYRLVEYAFSLPSSQKIRDGVTKVVLRNAMKGILPENVRTRMGKLGFSTPESIWLRTTLKDEIKAIFHSNSFRQRNYLQVEQVKKEFALYCLGQRSVRSIWRWVDLELWHRVFFH
jgi:asparagine synthase (glutamine-hydrolysing)